MMLRVAGLGLAPASASMNYGREDELVRDALLLDALAREAETEQQVRRQPDRLGVRAAASTPICTAPARPVAEA